MLGDHYKLLPVDLRDIDKLDHILKLADLDPRYVLQSHSKSFELANLQIIL